MPVLALPVTVCTPEDPPHSSSRALHFPFLFPLPHSGEVFPSVLFHSKCPKLLPFWRHYLYQLLHLPARTGSPCARSTLPAPALPPPGSSYSGVSLRVCSPFGLCPLEPRCPRAEAAALPPAGLGGGGALRPALCAVIGRDSVCRCRPMMERGGTGGPAPLGAGMRRTRSHRDSASESRPSPPSNARLAAAASRGRWAAA